MTKPLNTDIIITPRMKRTPTYHDVYTDAYDNLLYAILIQAIIDKDGYIDHKHRSGDDAIKFLESDGRQIYNYLSHRRKKHDIVKDTCRKWSSKGGVRYDK